MAVLNFGIFVAMSQRYLMESMDRYVHPTILCTLNVIKLHATYARIALWGRNCRVGGNEEGRECVIGQGEGAICLFVVNGTLNPHGRRRRGIKACLPRSFEFESPTKLGDGELMYGRNKFWARYSMPVKMLRYI